MKHAKPFFDVQSREGELLYHVQVVKIFTKFCLKNFSFGKKALGSAISQFHSVQSLFILQMGHVKRPHIAVLPIPQSKLIGLLLTTFSLKCIAKSRYLKDSRRT